MKASREIYGFSHESKEYARERASGFCEFQTCDNPNTGRVNHINGCFVSSLDSIDPKDIINPDQNAILLCEGHERSLDEQEKYQVECLLYESK